jgi:hypothetical protein
MTSDPKPSKPDNDIPDMEPPPASDILPGDPKGLGPVKEPRNEKPNRLARGVL